MVADFSRRCATKIPAQVFCMSWCPDFEFRGAYRAVDAAPDCPGPGRIGLGYGGRRARQPRQPHVSWRRSGARRLEHGSEWVFVDLFRMERALLAPRRFMTPAQP